MVVLNLSVCFTLMLMVLLPTDLVGAGLRRLWLPKLKPVFTLPPVSLVPVQLDSAETDRKADDDDNKSTTPIVESSSSMPVALIQSTGTTPDESGRRIEELENIVTTMKLETVELAKSLHSLQKELLGAVTKVSELSSLATQNTELTRLLTYFETFFGVLYSEVPEAFNANIPVETRLSRMNTYIGNRDAELAEIRPNPPAVVESDTTGITDEVASAVVQLSEENAILASKVARLEQDVATTRVDMNNGKTRKLFGTNSCACVEDLEERLRFLETATSPLLRPALNSVSNSSSPKSKKTGTTTSLITESELNIIRMGYASRAVSDTRKNVFSAIRHSHLLGSDERQVLSFDDVHVNKGRNFKNNSVFYCTTEGFYFYHFTVRSYDGHYMGVSLVKNGNMMTSIYADRSERSIMQSQSLVLHLTPGDEVWLELGSSERFAVHSDSHKYITFNGFLIFRGRLVSLTFTNKHLNQDVYVASIDVQYYQDPWIGIARLLGDLPIEPFKRETPSEIGFTRLLGVLTYMKSKRFKMRT